jgi:Spy/CpxP family protein refolding chaperone
MNIFRILILSTILLMISIVSYSQYDSDNEMNKNVKIEKRSVSRGKQMRNDALKLTDQQRNDIKKIRMNMKKAIMPLKNLTVEKRAHLKTLSTAEKVNLDEINKTIDDIFSLKAQIMKLREAARQDLRKLLTDEQRMIFDSSPSVHKKMNKKIIREFRED